MRAAETLVVDTAPELGVVLGVGDRDPLGDVMMPADTAREFQLLGIDVETIDVVEDAFGIVDDTTGGWAVPVSRRQRCHASPQAADQIVKLGEFGGAGAGQATSLG